jgi:hypothetical protein
VKISGENTSNGRRGTDITQQEEETQVDNVKMGMMPEKIALTEGQHIQELIIRHIVCTTVKYRSIRRHGAPVNSWEVDCKSYETIGMEIPYGKVCRPLSRRKGRAAILTLGSSGQVQICCQSTGRMKLTYVIKFIFV